MKNYCGIFFLSLMIISACKKTAITTDPGNGNASTDSMKYNADWTYATHGNSAPDYTTVFPQNAVNTLEITMTAAQWTSIRNNMKALYGADFGSNINLPPAGTTSTTEPDYVDVTLKFNGKTWKNVGYRLKGNSTLRTAWTQGNYKLPFRLNFDKFEDKYPGTTNQHFFGFEELSFSPGAKDQSLIHEKMAADVFRQAGIPAAVTAFYKVYVDIGSGLKYCGVYTAVEVPDDNMIKAQFGEESGNMYKPESNFLTFNQTVFEKKNNETAADYTDVKTFITALNSATRTSDPAKWRTDLEAIFNMEHFLKYLAINNTIVNWDSYGVMAHNYYLYNHTTKKLTWIPWDHNEAFAGSPGITGSAVVGPPGPPGPGGGGGMTGLSLTMNEVSSSWPLLRYIADDPIYFSKYKAYMKAFKDNVFTEAYMNGLIDKYQSLITPFAIGVNGEKPSYTYLTSEASFTSSFPALKTHVTARRALVTTFVL
jgi:spore coat protein CotH